MGLELVEQRAGRLLARNLAESVVGMRHEELESNIFWIPIHMLMDRMEREQRMPIKEGSELDLELMRMNDEEHTSMTFALPTKREKHLVSG